jgi:endo-1,4-beta-xylanase
MAYPSNPTQISGTGQNILWRYNYGSYSEDMTNAVKLALQTVPYSLPRGGDAVPDPTPMATAPGLKTYAREKGVAVGSAIPLEAFDWADPATLSYRNAVAVESNLIASNTQLKMEVVWPTIAAATANPNPSFTRADEVETYAKANGMAMRGVILVWHLGMPAWVSTGSATVGQLTSGNRPAAEKLIRNWISAAMGRYRGQIESWDVINEVTDGGQASGFRTDTNWRQAFGSDDYIKVAFQTAREFDPVARLCWCEENLENDNADGYFENRRTAVLKNLESLLRQGVPIHTLALQGHVNSMHTIDQTKLRTFLRNVAGLGLTIEITEFDIDDRNFCTNATTRAGFVRDLTRRFLDVVLDEPAVLNVTTWDSVLRDNNWLNDISANRYRWPTTERQMCLPLNTAANGYARMEMWNGMREAFRSAPNHKAIRDKLRGRVI